MAIEPTIEDIGRKVIYRTNYGTIEEGVIVSMNDYLVFVRYGSDVHCKGANRSQLEWKID